MVHQVHPLADKDGGWKDTVVARAALMLADRPWDSLPWQTQLRLLGAAEVEYGLAHEPRSGEHQAAADDAAYIAKRMREIARDEVYVEAPNISDPLSQDELNALLVG